MTRPAIILAGAKALQNGAALAPEILKRGGQMLGREFTSVHQAAFMLAFAGAFAKILALARDRLLASTFGASYTLDIYYAAFRIPDLLYAITLALSASTALIPILLERETVGQNEAKKFINSVATWFLILTTAACAISYFAMPYMSRIIAPGFDAEGLEKVTLLSRLLLLQVLILGLSNIASTIVQSAKKFAIYALSPVLYNLGIIAGILWLYPAWGLSGIIIGVVAGAFLHLLIQIPSVISLGYIPKFSFELTPSLKNAVLLSIPRSFGGSLGQAVFMIITAIASTLSAGGIAIFNLSYNLQSVPITIIGVSYSIAAFPFLANMAPRQNLNKFLSYFSSALRHVIFWSLPATALVIVLRAHIVRVILGAGEFGWKDTRLTAAALAIFSLSLVSQGLITLYIRAFYAAGHTKIPFVANLLGSITTVALSVALLYAHSEIETARVFLSSILRVLDLADTRILALPLAFSIGSLATAAILIFYFKKIWGRLDGGNFFRSISQITAAAVICGFVAFVSLKLFDGLFDLETFYGVAMHGLAAGLTGIAAWVVFLQLAKNHEFAEVKNTLKLRFWKTRPLTAGEPAAGTEL